MKHPPAADFDLFRLSKSKEAVDLSPNTLREYSENGLPVYRVGNVAFVSKSELALYIRIRSAVEKSHEQQTGSKIPS